MRGLSGMTSWREKKITGKVCRNKSIFRCLTEVLKIMNNIVSSEHTNPLQPSGHYMYRQFNIQQIYVLPTHTVFMCFVWIWEQTAIISLYNINWLVFITEI